MHYSVDDILFASMIHFATYEPDMDLLYISKKNYGKYRSQIAKFCGVTTRTLLNHLKSLIAKGFVIDTEVLGENGGSIPCYTFPYDYETKYQIVNNEMIWYLVQTRNNQCVKIYSYLLNKYLWKKQLEEKYVFTNRELMKVLGYNYMNNHIVSKMITEILRSFCREGVMNIRKYYDESYDEYGNPMPLPKMELQFVAEHVNQLKPIDF